MVLHLQHTHNLVEGAGAVTLAAAVAMKERIRGQKLAIVVSGCNITLKTLKWLMAEFPDGADLEPSGAQQERGRVVS